MIFQKKFFYLIFLMSIMVLLISCEGEFSGEATVTHNESQEHYCDYNGGAKIGGTVKWKTQSSISNFIPNGEAYLYIDTPDWLIINQLEPVLNYSMKVLD